MSIRTIFDAARYCVARQGEAGVAIPWLWKRISRITANYRASARVGVADDGEFLQVTINDRPYAWPREASQEQLLYITCELDVHDHPHQYLWGPTMIDRNEVVIDVGACEGAFSAMVAEIGARPIVIEPSPRMQRIVRRLFELRQLPEPTIVPVALSDEPGAAIFNDHDADVQGGRLGMLLEPHTGYPVDVRTLDDVVEELGLPHVDFIKCDAEGADVKILRGAMRTLHRFRPKLAFCTYHSASHFDEMRALLKPLGYHIRGKGLRQVGGRLNVVILHGW
jgi:FkbM family methyltransferase